LVISICEILEKETTEEEEEGEGDKKEATEEEEELEDKPRNKIDFGTFEIHNHEDEDVKLTDLQKAWSDTKLALNEDESPLVKEIHRLETETEKKKKLTADLFNLEDEKDLDSYERERERKEQLKEAENQREQFEREKDEHERKEPPIYETEEEGTEDADTRKNLRNKNEADNFQAIKKPQNLFNKNKGETKFDAEKDEDFKDVETLSKMLQEIKTEANGASKNIDFSDIEKDVAEGKVRYDDQLVITADPEGEEGSWWKRPSFLIFLVLIVLAYLMRKMIRQVLSHFLSGIASKMSKPMDLESQQTNYHSYARHPQHEDKITENSPLPPPQRKSIFPPSSTHQHEERTTENSPQTSYGSSPGHLGASNGGANSAHSFGGASRSPQMNPKSGTEGWSEKWDSDGWDD